MSKYFTSIFHEEVIPVSEFKGEAEAAHAARRSAEKLSGSHDSDRKKMYEGRVKGAERLRDSGTDSDYRTMTHSSKNDKDSAEGRKALANHAKDSIEKSNAHREKARDRKTAQKESFLMDIDLD